MEEMRCDRLKRILSENLSGYLKANRLSQKEAAERGGFRISTFNSWMRGISFPDDQNLLRLAGLFGVTPDELIRERNGSDRPGNEYMRVGEIELLRKYRENSLFQAFVTELVLLRSDERLEDYLRKLREL